MSFLGVVRTLFQNTPAGREAGEAQDAIAAESVLRSRDLAEMRTYLSGNGQSDGNVERVEAALVAALRRSRDMSSEDLAGYRDVFEQDSARYRQVESLRAALVRREEAQARREQAQEARDSAAAEGRCNSCMHRCRQMPDPLISACFQMNCNQYCHYQ
jgi:hypothetical protein